MRALLLILVCALLPAHVTAAPSIATTIRPLQFIARAIAGPQAQIVSIIDVNDSPHHFTLSPSDRLKLQAAELLIWAGPETEVALAGFFSRPAIAAKSLTVLELQDIVIHLHEDGEVDPHFWLDPGNGLLIARDLSRRLADLDPQNRQRYADNLDEFEARLASSTAAIADQLKNNAARRVAVYHNAYQYFEQHFEVQHVLDLVHNPEVAPSMRETLSVRSALAELQLDCLLLEADHNEALLRTLLAGRELTQVEVDPLGYAIEDTPQAYEQLLQAIARAYSDCQSTR